MPGDSKVSRTSRQSSYRLAKIPVFADPRETSKGCGNCTRYSDLKDTLVCQPASSACKRAEDLHRQARALTWDGQRDLTAPMGPIL